MIIPIEIESQSKQRQFLDYFNSKLRASLSSYSGQAGFKEDGSFESVVTGGFTAGDSEVVLSWKVVKSPDGFLEHIEIVSAEDDVKESVWSGDVSTLVTSSLAAALEERQETFFVRRQFFYVGPQLDGEYWLAGFRFAPANPEDPQPHLINAERPVVIDANQKAIDSRHLFGVADEFASRQAARLSLLLNVGLYKPGSTMRWVIVSPEDGDSYSERYHLGFTGSTPSVTQMPTKGELCDLGEYQGDLQAKYRYAGKLLSLPPETRRVFRAIEAAHPNMRDAFDRCSRLYQVGSVIGARYPSAGLAYRIAAVEAITQALPQFKGFSQFIRNYVESREGLDSALDFLYASVRSAHFHGGKFPLGEYSGQNFFDPLMDSEQIEKMSLQTTGYQITREAIISWLLSEVEPH